MLLQVTKLRYNQSDFAKKLAEINHTMYVICIPNWWLVTNTNLLKRKLTCRSKREEKERPAYSASKLLLQKNARVKKS